MKKTGAGILTVGSLKGGVGKTMLSLLLARYFSLTGYRVLLIDADPQATATTHVALVKKNNDEESVLSEFLEHGMHKLIARFIECDGAPECLPPEMVEQSLVYASELAEEAFWLLPNFIASSYYENTLVASGLHFALIKSIASSLESLALDMVIVDTPPYINAYTTSAVVASDVLLMPVELSIPSLESISIMMRLLSRLNASRMLGDLDVFIVPSKVRRSVGSKKPLMERLREQFGELVLTNSIPLTEDVHKFYAGKYSIKELITMNKGTSERLRYVLKEIEMKIVPGLLSEETLKRMAGGV